ncbi:MAG: 23S rRNA (adenine(2503)-C(2))-methyltransferase RlmN, partial [Acidobacteria bacterium]
MDQSELARLVEEIGQPGYRTQQLFEAIYRQRIPVIELISTLPVQLRRELSSRGWSIGSPEITSKFSS